MKNALLIILIFTTSIIVAQEKTWLTEKVNLKSIEVRRDSFDMIKNNKIVGYWIWEALKSDNQIIFKDTSVLTNIISEKFVLQFDMNKLITTNVDMKMWTNTDTLKVDINRATNKDIKAIFDIKGKSNKETTIDTIYKKAVILRPVIFGILPALTNHEKLNELLDVFFMSSGVVSSMNLKYIDEEIVLVKAGKFKTYKISFYGKNQTSNIIYIKKELPHRIIKVDVIGQSLTMELTKL